MCSPAPKFCRFVPYYFPAELSNLDYAHRALILAAVSLQKVLTVLYVASYGPDCLLCAEFRC